jgi:hypothetical protein
LSADYIPGQSADYLINIVFWNPRIKLVSKLLTPALGEGGPRQHHLPGRGEADGSSRTHGQHRTAQRLPGQ